MEKPKVSGKITLIGAGLAGSLLSIYLTKRGFQIEIYESRPDMRKVKIPAGRSINLALSTRGIHALTEIGLYKDIMKNTIPMRGRMIHSMNSVVTFQPYGKDETEVINAISRGQLNISLINEAEECGVKIHFNEKCTGMNFKKGELKLQNQITGKEKIIYADTVIGTDGSASAIRMAMLKMGEFNYSQQYLEHGYKELTIAAGPNQEFQIDKNALHIWPRKSFMLIGLPNLDGSFTCTLFFPLEGQYSFESLDTEEKVLRFFQDQFPDAVPLMPTLVCDFFSNPTGNLVTIRCATWHIDHIALLLGDAAHAIVPFFGQGMNCAFEDCTYLNQCVENHGADWKKVFEEFEKLRKVNTDAIADMALQNFIEMRDHVADANFLLRKKVGLALEKKHPKLFIPKYSMVTFHRIPYSVAKEKGEIQEKILDELCYSIESIEELDWGKADLLIKKELIET